MGRFDGPEVTIEWCALRGWSTSLLFQWKTIFDSDELGMAEFYAGCATAEEMLLARDVLMFFGCRVEASLHMDSAAARGICRREGVGKVKSLEVRTLWLQQVVKAKILTLKTVKSQDNCADLGTKTLAAGTLSLVRNLNGLVDKNTKDNVSRGVQSTTISPG